jgi:hypothetical protein
MKRRLPYFIVGLLILSIAYLGAQEPKRVAFTTKTSGQVTIKNYQNQTVPLQRGTTLHSGEMIESGSDGLAVIMFLDDKSILRIQKNTTLTVGGEAMGTGAQRAITKQVDMQFGKLRAEVSRQRQGEFQITTPISVASVKGTDFWTTSDPVLGDIFLGVEGLIEVQNLVSGGVIEVGGGQMGTSEPDGTTEVKTYVLIVSELLSVAEDLLTMDPAEIGEGDDRVQFNGRVLLVPETTYGGPAPTVGSSVTVSGTANDDGSVTAVQVMIEEAAEAAEAAAAPNEIRIQFEDPEGNTKEVIIIYQ